MSLGSRITKRGRGAVNANLVSTPREPLLFLYPQWGRNSSSTSPKRAATDDPNATILYPQIKLKLSHIPNSSQDSKSAIAELNAPVVRTQTNPLLGSTKTKKLSRRAVLERSSRHGTQVFTRNINASAVQTLESTRLSATGAKDDSRKAVQDSLVEKQPCVMEHDSKSQYTEDGTLQYQPLPVLTQPQPLPSKATGAEALLRPIKFSLETASQASKPSTVLDDVERMVHRIMHAAEETRKSEQSARSIREEFQDYRRVLTDSWTPDWRKILDILVARTPRELQWHEQPIQVVVPPETTRRLIHGVDTLIWEIGERYGCSIALVHSPDTVRDAKQKTGVFALSGSKSAISRTLADVLRIAPDAKIMTCKPSRALSQPQTSQLALDESQQTRSNPAPRFVVSFARKSNPRECPEDIPKPSVWTQQSLLDYVRDLTSTPPNRTVKYPQSTADVLSGLFRDPDPDLRAAITRTACHEALRYFVAANRMVDVRVLFVRMELFQIPLTSETFNIMLRGVAKNKDIHNFHFVLHMMLKRGLLPNGHTWIAFMMAMEDFEMKVHVAIAMKFQGLLMHKSIMKGVCEQLVQPEVELSIDAGQDQETFIAHMDTRYGRDWLTRDSGNLILDMLGSRGLISRCWDFLHFMDSRFKYPNQYSINIILNHCKQTHNIAGAVELMQNISPTWGFQPNQETFRILFNLAYATRSFNVAKVAWKYACIAGSIDASMHSRVKNSMRAAWHVPYTPRHRWAYYSGSVIFGTYCGLHPVRTLRQHAGTEHLLPSMMKKLVDGDLVLNDSKAIPRLNGVGPFPPNPEPLYKPFRYENLPFEYVQPQELEKYYSTMDRELRFDLYLPKYIAGFSPRFSFEKMLRDAWTQDKQWREDGTYRHAKLRWMISKAIRIPLKADRADTPDLLL